jgi:hypothetical protein
MLNNELLLSADVRVETPPCPMDIDLSKVSSLALSRIIEEVRNGDSSTTRAFDRVHNRHNR